MIPILVPGALAFAILMATPAPSSGTPVTLRFTGVLLEIDPEHPVFGGVPAGTPLQLRIRYDADLEDRDPSPEVGDYLATEAGTEIRLRVGDAFTLISEPTVSILVTHGHEELGDRIRIANPRPFPPAGFGPAFELTSIPGGLGILPSDALPLDVDDLSGFASGFDLAYLEWSLAFVGSGIFEVTAVTLPLGTVFPVPEPCGALLLLTALSAAAFRWKSRDVQARSRLAAASCRTAFSTPRTSTSGCA